MTKIPDSDMEYKQVLTAINRMARHVDQLRRKHFPHGVTMRDADSCSAEVNWLITHMGQEGIIFKGEGSNQLDAQNITVRENARWVLSQPRVLFAHKDDAALFKLTWG